MTAAARSAVMDGQRLAHRNSTASNQEERRKSVQMADHESMPSAREGRRKSSAPGTGKRMSVLFQSEHLSPCARVQMPLTIRTSTSDLNSVRDELEADADDADDAENGDDDFLALAKEVQLADDALTWLSSRNLRTLADFARCAPSEELLWSRVITPMALPESDLAAPARVVLMWERARARTITSNDGRGGYTSDETRHRSKDIDTSARGSTSDETRRRSKDLETPTPEDGFINHSQRLEYVHSDTPCHSGSVAMGHTGTASLMSHSRSLLMRHAHDRASTHGRLVQDADFWCDLMTHISDGENKDSKVLLEDVDLHNMYDMTSERILFSNFDVSSSGFLDVDELERGLQAFGFDIGQDGTSEIMRRILDQCGDDTGTSITTKEFEVLMKRLRLAELFTPNAGYFQWQAGKRDIHNPISVCDYTELDCRLKEYNKDTGDEEYKEFFFENRGAFARHRQSGTLLSKPVRPVRWIHMDATEGLDKLTLLRIAVKYYLHPLAVNTIVDNRASTRFDVYADNHIVSLDIFMLPTDFRSEMPFESAESIDFRSVRSSEECQPPPRVRIHRSHVTMCLSARHGYYPYDTLLSIHQERKDESEWLKYWRRDKACVSTLGTQRNLWDKLQKDLQEDPPKQMRDQKADFLLCEVIRRTIVELHPIAEAYAERLGHFYKQKWRDLPKHYMYELAEVDIELTDIARSVKPLGSVVRRLKDEEFFGKFAKMHFEELIDRLNEFSDDVFQLQQMAKLLRDNHHQEADAHANDILKTISVTGAFFMPAQYVAGVYGMNFSDMPELKMKYGYIVFWLSQIVIFAVSFLILARHMNWCGLRYRSRQCSRFLSELPSPCHELRLLGERIRNLSHGQRQRHRGERYVLMCCQEP